MNWKMEWNGVRTSGVLVTSCALAMMMTWQPTGQSLGQTNG